MVDAEQTTCVVLSHPNVIFVDENKINEILWSIILFFTFTSDVLCPSPAHLRSSTRQTALIQRTIFFLITHFLFQIIIPGHLLLRVFILQTT